MENKEKIEIKEEKLDMGKDGLVLLDSGKKQVDWQKVKLSFFLSPYRHARTFLVQEGYFDEKEINNGRVNKSITGWEMEKQDWEKQALELTMHNLRETKAVEMQNFIKDESAVVNQLVNMTKIAMNNLIIKKKDPKTGKESLALTNTSGFKQVTESTLDILKYSRERLGIAFNKEEAGLKNAINFDFDLINLDDFNTEKVINLFKKKDGQPQSTTKSIKADSISSIPEAVKA